MSADLVVGVHLQDDTAGLRRSLPTAARQQVTGRVRVLVVDDDADDDARTALATLAGWYPEVTVLREPDRLGRAAARNRILEEAGEAAIAWLDLGDVWHPRKLAVQHAVLLATKDPSRTLVTSVHRGVDLVAETERIVDPELSGDLVARAVDRRLEVPGGTLFGSAAAYRLLGGFDAGLSYRDDEELLLRHLLGGGHLVAAPGGPLSTGPVVRDHPTARDVAVAERRFRRVHGTALRARDAGRWRRAHRRELDRAARLHRKEDHAVASTAYRARADVTGAVDRLLRVLGRSGDATTTAPASRPAPADGPSVHHDAGSAHAEGGEAPLRPELVAVRRAAEDGDWRHVLAAWGALALEHRADADPTTIEMVARSHRALAQHEAAIAVAQDGLARWPHHPRIRMELAKSRTATTDWSRALHPAGADTSGVVRAEADGAVTSLGPLTAESRFVSGHLVAPASPLPLEVTLRVDDVEVVSTYAQVAGSEDRGSLTFSISCEQLLEFLGDGDRITVTADGRPLPIDGYGLAAEVRTGYPSRLDDLRTRLDDGAVFTKFGQLRPGYTPTRKRRTLDLVDEVAAVVATTRGYTCTPFYGNLLGAVREQDFIAHDVGGFDLGYVSAEVEPDAVRSEFVGLCRRLLDEGYHLELEPFGAMIRRRHADRIFVDLNYAWLTPQGELRLAYGWRHAPSADAARLLALRDTYLGARLVPILADAEAVLHQVYGSGWATPDQGFDLTHQLRRDERFLLGEDELSAIREHAPERVDVPAWRAG